MSKKQKNLAILASVFLMLLTIAPVSNAMHIMEGFLPVKYCILWGVICVPFLVIGSTSVGGEQQMSIRRCLCRKKNQS